MNLEVRDAGSNTQIVTVIAPAAPADFSGAIEGLGVSQTVAPANPARSGFLFQNTSPNQMILNTANGNPSQLAGASNPGSWLVPPGAYFPPYGYPPVPYQINVASLTGSIGDTYTYQEW